MAAIDKILGRFGLVKKSALLPQASTAGGNTNPFAIWQPETNGVDPRKAMAVYSGWVYGCVRAIAEEIGQAQLKLYKFNKEGKKEEILTHPVLDILDGVNSFQSGYDFRYIVAADLELTGDAFIFLDGVKNENDKPQALYVLSPAEIKIKKGDFRNPIASYIYTPPNGGKAVEFQPYQILHLKYPNPLDPSRGMGTVSAIAQWIDSDNYATEYNRLFFLKGAKIGGILETTANMTPEQLKRLKASFEDTYGGLDNSHKVALMPPGIKYTPMGETQKEMDFNAGQSRLRDNILAGFRVPKTILGAAESETNRATAETANYVFAARTITPKLKMIAAYLNEFFVPRFGEGIYVEFENIIPEDRAQTIAELTATTAGQPVVSVNEAREQYLGLGPVSGDADAVMTDFSKMPLGTPEKSMAPPRLRTNGITPPPAKKDFLRRQGKRAKEDMIADIMKGIMNTVSSQKKSSEDGVEDEKVGIAQMTDEEYDVVHKGFVVRVTPYERAMQKAIQELNELQEEEVLGKVEELTKGVKAISKGDIFNLADWTQLLINAATPILANLHKREGEAAGELLGRSDINVVTPETKRALDKAIKLMADSYTSTTLDLLKDTLEEGLQQGLSQPKLKNEIKKIYEFSNNSRALQVARTETFRVANGATHDAWKESGVVKTYRWYTAADERVCEFCGPMMKKPPIGINDTFFKKGETIRGRDGGTMNTDYGAVEYPPIHPNCRCYVRPAEIEI